MLTPVQYRQGERLCGVWLTFSIEIAATAAALSNNQQTATPTVPPPPDFSDGTPVFLYAVICSSDAFRRQFFFWPNVYDFIADSINHFFSLLKISDLVANGSQ